jgi:hypothetical protein
MAWERAEGRRWLRHRASTLRSRLSVHLNLDEITENGGNLEHWVNMTFSSKASRRWRETQRVMEEVGRSNG